MASAEFTYVGSELELFAAARNWKAYLKSQITPYLAGDVLEVGAGLGATTTSLFLPGVSSWTCLEPDAALANQIPERVAASAMAAREKIRVQQGVTSDLGGEASFDTILYIDVLEHIEDDRGELATAASLLRKGGRIIVLSPAHQSLFSPFDAAIGHFRRYSRKSLAAVTPADCRIERLVYLDSVGLLASAANRVFLRSAMPNPRQIQIWDRYMVGLSRWLDPIIFNKLGKSIVGIWKHDS